MVRIEIVESLYEEIETRFRKDASEVFDLIGSLEESPKKGKNIGNVAGILIKELRYKGLRFYFLCDGFKMRFLREQELTDLLLKFVRMSDKRHQQDTIDEIKEVLVKMGPAGFD
jgi:hypothetical protein